MTGDRYSRWFAPIYGVYHYESKAAAMQAVAAYDAQTRMRCGSSV